MPPGADDEMVKGDPGMSSIVDPTDDGPAVPTIGATGAHDGAHWMSGPVYVCGAEPGDVLQVTKPFFLYPVGFRVFLYPVGFRVAMSKRAQWMSGPFYMCDAEAGNVLEVFWPKTISCCHWT